VFIAAPIAAHSANQSPEIVRIFRGVRRQAEPEYRARPARQGGGARVVVSADGWILSKHKANSRARSSPASARRRELDAELVGFDVPFDLAISRWTRKT